MEENKTEEQLERVGGTRKYDVFISYSRHDITSVANIKEELEALGFVCWMDIEGIESGSRVFSEKIISAIDVSSTMLFFLSADSQGSEWALKEIDYATDEQKHVVIVRFNDDPMTKKFRFDFKRTDIIDWRDSQQRAKLINDLMRWSNRLPINGNEAQYGNCNPRAAYEMALRYKIGNGVERNLALAASLFKIAAEQDILAAQNDYGLCLQNGQGVPKDCVEAVKWYRRAAEGGYALAQLNLGYCYHIGAGVAKDPQEAVVWYRASADKGNAWAQCNLGMCYEMGDGVEQDDHEALHWYSLAADQNDATAIKALRRLSRQMTPVSVAADTDFNRKNTVTLSSGGGDDRGDIFGGVSTESAKGRVGDYYVESVIGMGAHGRVYKGVNVDTSVPVALKVLRAPKSEEDRILKKRRLDVICRTLEKIDPDSNFLARPIDVFEVQDGDSVSDGGVRAGDILVSMTLSDGEPSDSWCRKLPRTSDCWMESVFEVCGQVAFALDSIHSAGLVHRDVSPTNIMVASEDYNTLARLCDFDLTEFQRDLQQGSPIVGTPGFIAPEILTATAAPGKRSDQYSLACVLYHWLAGRSPYGHVMLTPTSYTCTTEHEVRYNTVPKGGEVWDMISVPPPAIPFLTKEQNAAFAKAFSFSPSSRYSSCFEMVDAVRNGISVADSRKPHGLWDVLGRVFG